MKTIGIIGGGQLAQLLAVSAYQLGLKTLCFVKDDTCPASRTSPVFVAHLDDQNSLEIFAKQVDVITIENENIDISVLTYLSQLKPVYPNATAVKIAQDRLLEKQFLSNTGVKTAEFFEVNAASDFNQTSLNGILKTRRLGYDSKGQIRIRPNTDYQNALTQLNQPSIYESFVNFDFEASLLIARNRKGDIESFPLIHNRHDNGILRTSNFLKTQQSLQQTAEEIGKTLISKLEYIGLLAIEFFVRDGELIANEMAPRVHNSGHLTIEGCNVSQFVQHLRAITNMPLIKPKIIQPVTMHNIISEWPKDLSQFHHVYDYGKAPRKNRKLGHGIKIF